MELVTIQSLTTAPAPGTATTTTPPVNTTTNGGSQGTTTQVPGQQPQQTGGGVLPYTKTEALTGGVFTNPDGTLKWTAYAGAGALILGLGILVYFLLRKS